MNSQQRDALAFYGADIDGALYRFGGNEKVYTECLEEFLADASMEEFKRAYAAGDWNAACLAAHTIKGAAGNMGFVPLMRAAEQVVALLRAGRQNEAGDAAAGLKAAYSDIAEGIDRFFLYADK